MFSREHKAKSMCLKKLKTMVLSALTAAVILMFSACTATTGSIIILEGMFGAQFDISFMQWSDEDKCEMSLEKGDKLQIEITRESGELDLSIIGKNGSEAYTGSNPDLNTFTVTVSETDEYVILLKGKNATGNIKIKNISQ